MTESRRRLTAEIAVVLGLSLGLSALYATVNFARRLTLEQPLSSQQATINRPLADSSTFDLIYQLLGIASQLAPVALVVFLLWSTRTPRLGALGLGQSKVVSDIWWGVALAGLIGLPGLGLYLVGVQLGITVTIVPSALEDYWWTIPVLLLRAATAGVVEETIAVGYLTNRLELLRFTPWVIVLSQAVLRGFYHLYQGVGPFIGNVIMGVVFGWYYLKTRRLGPLITAHALIDAVAFVGYPLVSDFFPETLGFAQ